MYRRSTLSVVATGLALLAPIVTMAQETEPIPSAGMQEVDRSTRAELEARLDYLRPLLEEAREDLAARQARDREAARIAAANVATVDTIQVGLATIVTPLDQVELARELFTEVWNEHFSLVRSSPIVEETTFVFQWSRERVPIYAENARLVQFNRWTRRDHVKGAIQDAIAASMIYDLKRTGSPVAEWVSGNPFARLDLERAYRRLATRSSIVTRACFAGDIPSCASSLALGTSTDEAQLRAWYTPEERRLIVARTGYTFSRWDPIGWNRCVEESVLEACDPFFQLDERDHSPLAATVRETVLAYAIERGGPGAWERLIEDSEMTPIEALEYTASLPLYDLLDGWRTRLMNNRPDGHERNLPMSGMTLLWSLLFVGLGMRSTRWRFG